MSGEVPAGFEELPAGLGFTDVLRPVYRRGGDVPAIGLFVQPQHTNLIQICHGGVLMTMADIAAAWGIHAGAGEFKPAPTLNLSFDFIAAAREGDWLEGQADRVTVKRRVGFASGVITSGEKLVLRFSGSFFIPEHQGFKADSAILDKLHGQGELGSG